MNILKTLLGESFFSPRMEHWEFVSRRVTLPPSMNDMVLSNVNTKCFDARWSAIMVSSFSLYWSWTKAERLNDSVDLLVI